MLKITKSVEPIHVSRLTVCVYAPPGVGKSTLGFSAESPLLLDFDGGAYRAGNRGDCVQISHWQDVAGISADDLAPYNTIVIDTAGRCLDYLAADIIERNPKMGRGGALTLQGYGELKAQFIAWTKLLRSFGKDVVLLAHSDEQRNGDELIERLDVQGASKNEIYKVADAMGRLAIIGGKRVLNFNPTDTSYGKNPAQLDPLSVPDIAQEPRFMAGVIQRIKNSLNALSEAQKAETERLAKLAADVSALETVDEFNAQITEFAHASPKDKAILVKAGTDKGFLFDKKTKQFQVAA